MWGVLGSSPCHSQQGHAFSARVTGTLSKVPCLLDAAAAPCDVLPVSSALHRVFEEDHVPTLHRRHSSPAELNTLQTKDAQQLSKNKGDNAAAVTIMWFVLLFVTLDASKNLAVSWAARNGHMCAPLAICSKNGLSIGCGMMLATILDGSQGVWKCLDIRRAVRVLPIAWSFAAAQIFSLQALRAFDAGSLKIISQVNLPITALLSWLVLDRRLSAQQWLATILLFILSVAFLQVRMLFFEPFHQADKKLLERTPDKVIGMFYCLAGITLSCCASILAERFLKVRCEVPFYIQKTNLMLGELVASIFMVKLNPERDTCTWEQVWDWRQAPIILLWVTHGWIAGLLVKQCSALVKNISHILSALVIYFGPGWLSTESAHEWPVTLAGALVLDGVLLFATSPMYRRLKKRSRDSGERPGSRKDTPTLARSNSEAAIRSSTRRDARKGAIVLALGGEDTDSGTMNTVGIGFLVVCFILLDATKPMLVTWAQDDKAPEERFINGTFVLVQTSLSLLVGMVISIRPSISLLPMRVRLHRQWRLQLRKCVDLRAVIQQLPVSGCLCLSKFFLIMALGRLDAGTVRVFGQATLPFVGVSAALFFSKRYTAQQWCALVAISVGLVTFYYVKAQVQFQNEALGGAPQRRIDLIGVLLILSSISFNCLGALFVERFLKQKRGALHEQKSQLLLGEMILNALLLCVCPLLISDPAFRAVHSPWHRGFFAGWDRRVLTCTMIWIPAGWTTTMLVKRYSNVVKTIAQSTSGVLTYIFSVVPLTYSPRPWSWFVTKLGPPLTPEPFSSPVVLLAVSVTLAALAFGSDSAPPPQNKCSDSDATRESARDRAIKAHTKVAHQSLLPWKPDSAYNQLLQGKVFPFPTEGVQKQVLP